MKKHTILIGLLIIVAVFVLYFKNPQKPENPKIALKLSNL